MGSPSIDQKTAWFSALVTTMVFYLQNTSNLLRGERETLNVSLDYAVSIPTNSLFTLYLYSTTSQFQMFMFNISQIPIQKTPIMFHFSAKQRIRSFRLEKVHGPRLLNVLAWH